MLALAAVAALLASSSSPAEDASDQEWCKVSGICDGGGVREDEWDIAKLGKDELLCADITPIHRAKKRLHRPGQALDRDRHGVARPVGHGRVDNPLSLRGDFRC